MFYESSQGSTLFLHKLESRVNINSTQMPKINFWPAALLDFSFDS